MRERKSRLTYSNVMVTVLMFVVLGGTAYATRIAPRNTVVSYSIKNGQVKTPDIAKGAVNFVKLACPGDNPDVEMVKVGSVCIDRYEASVWSQPDGGIQYGVDEDDYPCLDNGQDCKDKIFARSIPGVTPSRFITWFQAQQALANSGKRLPSNAEWQMAVAGTPDAPSSGDVTFCNVSGEHVLPTGQATLCVSSWGTYDMVGNLGEMVADWMHYSSECGSWPGPEYGDDYQCFQGVLHEGTPGILVRGGSYTSDEKAGPFAIDGIQSPVAGVEIEGFRGAA